MTHNVDKQDHFIFLCHFDYENPYDAFIIIIIIKNTFFFFNLTFNNFSLLFFFFYSFLCA